MSEIAQPQHQRGAAVSRDLFEGLSLRIPVTWDATAYAALVVLGFGFRLWDLGARAMHHDESLHAYYSYQLLQGNGYEHSPLLHGPFQFFGTALTFFLTGGANDFTARLLPALFGGALVVLPLAFRSRLGKGGALAAARCSHFRQRCSITAGLRAKISTSRHSPSVSLFACGGISTSSGRSTCTAPLLCSH